MSEGATPMPRWRRRLITGVVLGIAAGHVLALITADQHWPFTSYEMFAQPWHSEFECIVPYAVPEDAARPEFRLYDRHEGMYYLKLRYAFDKISQFPWRNGRYAQYAERCPTTPADASDDCVRRQLFVATSRLLYTHYEKTRKQAGTPPLRGVRLYNVQYERTADGGYVVTGRTLVQEWMKDGP